LNRDIALRDDRGWQVGPHLGAPGVAAPQPQASTIDFARFLRILHEWRWLILAATALGLILAVLATLLTTPLYRARVSLEVNPPRVEIMDDGTVKFSTLLERVPAPRLPPINQPNSICKGC